MPEFAPLDIPESALRIVRKGMKMVTHGGLGTARKYNLSSDFGGMAGKTGTVQVKRITKEQREAGIVKNIDIFPGFSNRILIKYFVQERSKQNAQNKKG